MKLGWLTTRTIVPDRRLDQPDGRGLRDAREVGLGLAGRSPAPRGQPGARYASRRQPGGTIRNRGLRDCGASRTSGQGSARGVFGPRLVAVGRGVSVVGRMGGPAVRDGSPRRHRPRRRWPPGRSASCRGRPDRSTASWAVLRPITSAKIEGTTSKVATVDITRPPITARPSGACIWLPRSSARAIGTMPTVIAQAVIRIGRRRSLAPTIAASVEDFARLPVLIHERHQHDRVRHRDAQAHDRAHERLDVQRGVGDVEDGRDAREDSRHGADRDQGQARRLEVGGQEQEDHEHGDPQPDPQRLEHLVHRRELAHGLDPHARGRFAGGGDRLGRPGARPGPCPRPRRSR